MSNPQLTLKSGPYDAKTLHRMELHASDSDPSDPNASERVSQSVKPGSLHPPTHSAGCVYEL